MDAVGIWHRRLHFVFILILGGMAWQNNDDLRNTSCWWYPTEVAGFLCNMWRAKYYTSGVRNRRRRQRHPTCVLLLLLLLVLLVLVVLRILLLPKDERTNLMDNMTINLMKFRMHKPITPLGASQITISVISQHHSDGIILQVIVFVGFDKDNPDPNDISVLLVYLGR